jgi:hypothetical protein
VKLDYTQLMRSWLWRFPMWFRLAFFFGAIWLLVVVFRAIGLNDGPLFSWADVRYFIVMWGIFVVAYYVGLMVWNAMKKNDRT